MRRTLAAVGRILAGVGMVLVLAPGARAESGRPALLRDVGFDQRIGAQVPLDLPFRDETGGAVRLGDYAGRKPILLVPAYYACPMLCTLVLNGVVSALRAIPFDIGDQFTVVTFSFDPRETPVLAAATKERYLGEYRRPGATAGWRFLTGDEDAIRRLTGAIGFRYAWDPEHQQFAHASGVVVLTPDGTVSRYFYGVEYAPRDLRLALVEASTGRIGSAVDQLLLFCFHYDPATGRYGATVVNAVRAAGVLTLLALVATIGTMLRRERTAGVRS